MHRILFLSIFMMTASLCYGQSNVISGIQDEYYFRVLQISGISDENASFMLRPYEFTATESAPHPWRFLFSGNQTPFYSPAGLMEVDFFEPVWFQSYNSTLPRGNNDGAVWQGKGYNTAFSIGAALSTGPLHVQFRPVIGMAQNRYFDPGPHRQASRTVTGIGSGIGLSEYSYPYSRGVDFVQRYGDDLYSWFDLGESSVELRYSGLKLALSNKQLWSGPAVNQSLHFGYSAPGFRHVYFGTYRPVQTFAGVFEFAYIFGKTVESDYYTENRVMNSQSVNSLIFVYRPWFTDRFSFGAVRTFFHPYPEDFSEYRNQAKKLFQTIIKDDIPEEDARGTFPDNQIASIFFRYFVPEHGFEFYTEYGRNDHNADWRDFRGQPNHYRAYTIGLVKTTSLTGTRMLAVNFEMNQFEVMRTALTRGGRALAGWYTHDKQILGVSNNGQIMGSGYGPGANMQKLRADIYDMQGRIGFKLARITYDNSRLDNNFSIFRNANEEEAERHEVRNVEIMFGVEATLFLLYDIELTAALEQSYIMNQYHLKDNDLWNTRLELVLRKNISGWKR